jgi:signal transduction histidine kinase
MTECSRSKLRTTALEFHLRHSGSLKRSGLLGMRERAAIFGGHVEIAGIPGKGTTVIVRMPIQ